MHCSKGKFGFWGPDPAAGPWLFLQLGNHLPGCLCDSLSLHSGLCLNVNSRYKTAFTIYTSPTGNSTPHPHLPIRNSSLHIHPTQEIVLPIHTPTGNSTPHTHTTIGNSTVSSLDIHFPLVDWASRRLLRMGTFHSGHLMGEMMRLL